jgi:hypothetical protein
MKLEAKDLRIGNLVNNLLNKAKTIKAIFASQDDIIFNDDELQSLDLCSPIPITEDWLNKCKDLKREGNEMWFELSDILQLRLVLMKDGLYLQLIGAPELSFQDEQWIGLERINYLHELQNLYKELKKEELKIIQ